MYLYTFLDTAVGTWRARILILLLLLYALIPSARRVVRVSDNRVVVNRPRDRRALRNRTGARERRDDIIIIFV